MEELDSHHSIPEPSGGLKETPHSRYVQRPSNRPSNIRPATLHVPTIDLGLLLSSPSEIAKLDDALRAYGLFHLVNHGLPTPLLDRVLSTTREFFNNNPSRHRAEGHGQDLAVNDDPPRHRREGYGHLDIRIRHHREGYGQDPVTSDDQVLDWCQRLLLTVLPEKERKVDLWPSLVEDVMLEYHDKCQVAAKKVVMAIGEALGLGSNYFEEVIGDDEFVTLRLNSYPRCERPDLVVGLKPHRDLTAITMVLQDPEVNGCYHLLRGGEEWMEVPVIPGALLVNVGDEMEIKSNGIYKSPMHRVVTSAEKERVSVVLFYLSAPHKELSPAKALVSEERPRMYKDVILKDYLDSFWSAFAMGKNVIDTVKI